MKKIKFLAALVTLLTLFSFGCNNSDHQYSSEASDVIPSFEELVEINSYEQILEKHANFYVKNVWVDVELNQTYCEESVYMIGEGKVDYHSKKINVNTEECVQEASRDGNEWYAYSNIDPFTGVLELGETFVLDYTLSEIIYGTPVGKGYIVNDHIVYHASFILEETEDYPAKREDLTYYFNKESKLIEKIEEVDYNNKNVVSDTYLVEFAYDVNMDEIIETTLLECVYNSEKRIDVEVIVDTNELETKRYSLVGTTDMNVLVTVNDKVYALYSDAEFTNMVSNLSAYEGQKSVTLYAKALYAD
jgi:hypothetical protein